MVIEGVNIIHKTRAKMDVVALKMKTIMQSMDAVKMSLRHGLRCHQHTTRRMCFAQIVVGLLYLKLVSETHIILTFTPVGVTN